MQFDKNNQANHQSFDYQIRPAGIDLVLKWVYQLNEIAHAKASIDTWLLHGRAAILINDQADKVIQQLQFALKAQNTQTDVLEMSSRIPCDIEPKFDITQLTQHDTTKPIVFLVSAGTWLFNSDDNSEQNEFITKQKYWIDQLIEASSATSPYIVITCVSLTAYSDVDSNFRCVGRFDKRFLIEEPTLKQRGLCFLQQIGEEYCDQSLLDLAEKVGRLAETEFSSERAEALYALGLKRKAVQEQRKINFHDVLVITLRSTTEMAPIVETNQVILKRVAIHESGHACMAIVDSDGENIPEYITILESINYKGVVVDSYSYHMNKHGHTSYRDLRHMIRVSLAGRAAEQLILGAENIGVESALSDLKRATQIAYDMFALYGISTEMECEENAGNNLLVLGDAEPRADFMQRMDDLIRQYLEKQYKHVITTLKENQQLLDILKINLSDRHTLLNEELNEIYRNDQLVKLEFKMNKHRDFVNCK